MPRGAYTAKQDRKAKHIEEGYEKRGVSKKEAESRAWATVNKQDKGGKNSGHGRSSRRSAAAKKGCEARRRRGTGCRGLGSALQDLDSALDGAKFALGEAVELAPK